MFSIYAQFLVSNPREKMSKFVTGVADLVKEEFCMGMLHDDITLARFMVYAQSIEKSKHGRIYRNLKRSGSSDQGKTTSKKRSQT